MKNNILFTLILFALVACKNQEAPKREIREMEKETSAPIQIKADTSHIHVFSCPMHAEVTGKEGDKCPKCGMALVHHD